MRGKEVLIAVLSGTLILGAGIDASAKAKKADNRQTVVDVSLKPTSESRLTDYVYETVDPNSANYHKYLSPNAFAKKFGQSSGYLKAFKDYLHRYHVKAAAYPGNLALKVRGTKAAVNRAFHAKYVSKKKTAYRLPGALSKKVVAVIGVYAPNPKKAAKKKSAKSKTSAQLAYLKTIGKTANLPTIPKKPNTGMSPSHFSRSYGAMKFANHYRLTPLYKAGLAGRGQRIGIISNVDFHIGDIENYWKQAGVNASPSQIHRYYTVSGKKSVQALSGTELNLAQIEVSTDIESASAVAPKAGFDVYIDLPANNATTLPTAHYTAFMSAIGDNNDNQISTSFAPGNESTSSWLDHSASLSQYNHAFNLMLEQAAAQGITVFRASGDHGPYEEATGHQVQTASTSPYQVLVGGTTLPYAKLIHNKLVVVPRERAWGDTYTATASELKKGFYPGGGGGGFSALNPTPRYQLGIAGVNTFRAIQLLKYIGKGKFKVNAQPKTITGTRHGRNVPDVAGNADPRTGYAIYASGYEITKKNNKYYRTYRHAWGIGGGTSFTSPQMAAANAVMNSGRSTAIGFWNPQIYRFAKQADSPFNVLDSPTNNNNLYYTGQPGKLYNQATGLGTINFDKLFTKFNQSAKD